MADFVAVIRRAVDGLADNTPEMRARVYEKARSAVTRQLESMKPRPPEEMLRRQFDKLDAAIIEVENEHAEALPPLEEEVAGQPHVADVEESQAHQPEPVEEPVHSVAEISETETVDYETSGYEAPVESYEDEAVQDHEVVHEEAAVWRAEAEPSHEPYVEPQPLVEPVAEVVQPEPEPADVQEHWHPHDEEVPAPAEAESALQPVETVPEWYEAAKAETLHTYGEPVSPADHGVTAADDDVTRTDDPAVPVWARSDDHSEPTERHPEPAKDSVAASPAAPTFNENAAVSDFDDFVRDDLTPMPRDSWPEAKMPPATEDLSWDPAPFDEVSLEPAPTSTKAESSDGDELAAVPAAAGAAARQAQSIGGPKAGGNGRPAVSAKDILDMEAVEARRPAKAIRTAPRRKINLLAVGLGLLGLAILGGGGYAAWSNKDALSSMVGGVAPSSTTTPETGKPNATGSGAPSSSNAGDNGTAETASNSAAVSDGSVNNKFTQRLKADGTEVDEGAGTQVGTTAGAEGKSVAEQNVAAKETASAEAGGAPATNAAGATAADQKALPVGGQKMFLYEERLGQSVPTAIEGTVIWSVKREQGANGREEPTVTGQIVVPDRGLSALLTLRRNTDPSLPASHLIEIVFSLPPGFEGGSIENVQRIALKQTEQDRGNALIAVPAKITDDFHMIALNDFPEAMKTNLDLLRTRNWIDIPLTYRNGRRALLTMEKGSAGVDAFNTAIREWSTLGNTANSQ